jgi:hypothetical protein
MLVTINTPKVQAPFGVSLLHPLLIIQGYNQNKMNCELMLTYDTPALRQTGSRNLTGPKNASHDMGYLYEACDQISDFCHQ